MLSDLAVRWGERLASAEPRFIASDIYGGRAFQEAAAAAKRMDSRLLIVSAGLGLIDASEHVPPYSCTVLIDAPDSIASRAIDTFTPAAWWRELLPVSPYSTPLHESLSGTSGVICAALSEAYIEMLAADLIDLPATNLERLRIFTRAPASRIEPALRRFVMPYDDRLDGPDSTIAGTRSDFAGRAVRHFAEHLMNIGQDRTAEADATAVAAALDGWRMPARFERVRHDDETMRDLIAANWQAANGSSARLLRLFRDELNIACEQGRFAELVREVRASRA
ncbi:hypothetical protein [Rhodospirillaceae bacterium SYSU D60014]|uniref:hypothetical protein n=1 Tax=Virgifigura deserti TaxID=2268457 RepID=UPI000E664C93